MDGCKLFKEVIKLSMFKSTDLDKNPLSIYRLNNLLII